MTTADLVSCFASKDEDDVERVIRDAQVAAAKRRAVINKMARLREFVDARRAARQNPPRRVEMREQVCFEHHAHDESCYADREAERHAHLEWCRQQCEAGWPTPGWPGGPASAPKQHAPIEIDAAWRHCPLCGRQVR